ncbi:MAG: NAD(P)/FAD-dependent oxidoreductase [Nitrospinota bacterium]
MSATRKTIEDVVVVGAGPAGSSAAFVLGEHGHRVTVLEEHPRIGEPENCAGLIGAELFSSYDLPRQAALRDFSSASFYAPGGERAEVQFDRPMAYVVQRGEFDRALARRAQSVGATYLTGMGCTGISVRPGRVELAVKPAKGSSRGWFSLSARAVVLATGIRSGLHKVAGLSPPTRYMEAAHTVVRMHDVAEIEVFLGREWAPGYFAWALPFDGEHVRLGVCSERHPVQFLKRLFSHPMISRRLISNSQPILAKVIPVTPVAKSYAARLLLVGDAGGQVKPTTGGGIGCGIVCGHIAGEILSQALLEDDLSEGSLQRYEAAWHQEMMWELRTANAFRAAFGLLADADLDGLVKLLQRKKLHKIIRLYGDFDRHSLLLRRLAQIREVASLLGIRMGGRQREEGENFGRVARAVVRRELKPRIPFLEFLLGLWKKMDAHTR